MSNFKKDISTFGILCASLGGIIGSGWLFSALYAAQSAGPASLISWVIGGVSVLFLALTFAELSTMFPVSGGLGSFSVITHGKLAGFTLTWVTWLTYVVSISQEVQSTVLYMGNRYPGLVKKSHDVTVFTATGYMVSFGILLVLMALNSFGAKFLSRTNTLISLWKLVVPVAVVIFFIATKHDASHFTTLLPGAQSAFAPDGITGILAAVALAGVVYSFSGFQHGAMLAGETKNPQTAVPLAVVGSVLICMVLYISLQYAFIAALPEGSLVHGWKHLSFPGDSGPLAGIASLLGLGWLASTLYIDAIISPLGTGILYLASSARIIQNMGTNGTAPYFFSKLTSLGIPFRAIIFNLVIAILGFLPFEGWQAIVSFLSSALVFSFAIGPLCLVSLRKQQPLRKRPFRLPGYQYFSFMAFYVCNLMIYWSGWSVVWKLTLSVGVGSISFIIANLFQKNPITKLTADDYKASIWLLPYLCFFCVFSYFSSFSGGTGDIPLGWDFVILAAFSGFIFYLSQKMALPKNIADNHAQQFLV